MVTNNLLIKVKDGDAETVEKVKATLLSMRGKIDALKDIQVYLDVRHGASSYDLMLVTRFDSAEGMDAYLTDPVHLEVAKYIVSVMVASASVCYES
jgi:hypothetical protein